MAFQPTQDGALFIMNWALGDVLWQNHLWFSQPDFEFADMSLMADIIANQSYENLYNIMASVVHMNYVLAIDERTQDGPSYQTAGPGWSGNISGDPLPLSAALLTTTRTALRGRSYRGRNYWTGMPESKWASGEFDGSVATAVLLFLQDIWDDGETNGWIFGVRSGYLNHVKRTTAIITPASDVLVRSNKPAHQRDRDHRP